MRDAYIIPVKGGFEVRWNIGNGWRSTDFCSLPAAESFVRDILDPQEEE